MFCVRGWGDLLSGVDPDGKFVHGACVDAISKICVLVVFLSKRNPSESATAQLFEGRIHS